jgi:hypothetical protein
MSEILKDFVNKNLGTSNFQKQHIAILSYYLEKWKGLYTRFVPNSEEQQNFIAVLEDVCIENPKAIEFFHVVIQLLNSEKFSVLEDEVIKNWGNCKTSEYPTCEGEKSISEEYHKLFVDKMKKFLDQL